MSPQPTSSILAFVPVLHKGYIDFFSKHEGDIWIFGPNLIEEFVHLTRDLRIINSDDLVKALSEIFPNRKIKIANPEAFGTWEYDITYMPEDEVGQEIQRKYLANKKVEFISVFLRWNKIITFKEHEINPKTKITHDDFHKKVLDQALEESKKSSDWWRQIGAIVIKEGKVIIKAHNHHLPTDFHLMENGDPRSNFDAGQHQNIFTSIHAEADLIARSAKEGLSLEGTSLYSTTFPCPNCARLIAMAGIKTVYYSKGYSLFDAEKILNHFGVEVILVQ